MDDQGLGKGEKMDDKQPNKGKKAGLITAGIGLLASAIGIFVFASGINSLTELMAYFESPPPEIHPLPEQPSETLPADNEKESDQERTQRHFDMLKEVAIPVDPIIQNNNSGGQGLKNDTQYNSLNYPFSFRYPAEWVCVTKENIDQYPTENENGTAYKTIPLASGGHHVYLDEYFDENFEALFYVAGTDTMMSMDVEPYDFYDQSWYEYILDTPEEFFLETLVYIWKDQFYLMNIYDNRSGGINIMLEVTDGVYLYKFYMHRREGLDMTEEINIFESIIPTIEYH